MVQAILFDLDGTLIDSERANLAAWQEAAARFGLELTDRFYHSLIGLSRERSDQRLREFFGGECDVDRLRATRREIFYANWDGGRPVAPKPGLEALLDWLNHQGIASAVATSSSRWEAEAKLSRSRMHFSVMVCGDEVASAKPEPDVFLEAARRLGKAPAHCLVVEDSLWGVEAARRAGMAAVFIPDLIGPDEATRAYARVLSHLGELIAHPDYDWARPGSQTRRD